jgi:hypothetical protein
MNSHLAGDGFLRHMNLMKKSLTSLNEDKIAKMQQEISESKKKIKSAERRILELESMVRHEKNGNHKILVEDAGTGEVNGVYTQSGYDDGAFKYSRAGQWNGKEGEFVISRSRDMNEVLCWWIEFDYEDGNNTFYKACVNNLYDTPPMNDWRLVDCGFGDDPSPNVLVCGE